MKKIMYSLTKVPDAITDRTVYTAHVHTNGTIDEDALAELMAVRTRQEVQLLRYFINALSDELKAQMLAGNRINLGQLATGFVIRGAFTSEDDRFDPERHQLVPTVRTLDPLRHALAAITPENITHGLVCSVGSVMDAVTKESSAITGTNRVLIEGVGLGIQPDNPDEGVWLVSPDTGLTAAAATVERSDSQTIDCVFQSPPAPGTYTLVVSCRNGARESLKPAVAKVKNIAVKAA